MQVRKYKYPAHGVHGNSTRHNALHTKTSTAKNNAYSAKSHVRHNTLHTKTSCASPQTPEPTRAWQVTLVTHNLLSCHMGNTAPCTAYVCPVLGATHQRGWQIACVASWGHQFQRNAAQGILVVHASRRGGDAGYLFVQGIRATAAAAAAEQNKLSRQMSVHKYVRVWLACGETRMCLSQHMHKKAARFVTTSDTV